MWTLKGHCLCKHHNVFTIIIIQITVLLIFPIGLKTFKPVSFSFSFTLYSFSQYYTIQNSDQ